MSYFISDRGTVSPLMGGLATMEHSAGSLVDIVFLAVKLGNLYTDIYHILQIEVQKYVTLWI